jgi:hypothetical protein
MLENTTYNNIVRANIKMKKFIKGWLNRSVNLLKLKFMSLLFTLENK